MKKKWVTIIGTGVLVSGLAIAGGSFAKSDKAEVRGGTIRIQNQAEADFPTMARIKMDQAVQNALTAVPGQVLKTELEEENGFLVYGVEVVTPDRTIMDVKVDAGSGKILAMDQDETDEHHDGGHHDREEEDQKQGENRDRDEGNYKDNGHRDRDD